MTISGFAMKSGTMTINSRIPSLVRACPPRPLPSLLTPNLASFPTSRISYKLNLCSPRGSLSLSCPAAITPVTSTKKSGFSHAIPRLPCRKSKFTPPRASKDTPFSFRFPPMTKKPKLWWRILACIPYLLPLHNTWIYAETAYNLHPFLAEFEHITSPFLKLISKLPPWFLMAYPVVAYLFILRRKEWPHFFRFHVILGVLLEIFLQVLGTASRWLPRSYYYGKLGMHFWAAVAFAHLFTVLECIRCVLCGMYADVPFASDAAYIQMPYD